MTCEASVEVGSRVGLAKHLSSSLEETPFPGRLSAGKRAPFLFSRRQVRLCEYQYHERRLERKVGKGNSVKG